MSGPLAGIRIVELAGVGPSPYGCMLLADAGADVVRLVRKDLPPGSGLADFLARSRPSIAVDLKHPTSTELVLDLVAAADVFVEGYRPGVAERLGLGPDVCVARNPRLVYARMTGWGQQGPLAGTAGHDIDYIARAGALWGIGRSGDRPVPPVNLLADFGGGGMLLAFGVCAALVERATSGKGQVLDAAMLDGAASITTFIHGLRHGGLWRDERGANILDTGAPFYEVYETADGRYVAVGAIEPQFYAALLDGLGIDLGDGHVQMDASRWPDTKRRFAEVFATKTRDEWVKVFEGTDACVAPVLSMDEVHTDPHNLARGTFVEVDGVSQPGPAPRFSRTPGAISGPPDRTPRDPEEVLAAWGMDAARIARFRGRLHRLSQRAGRGHRLAGRISRRALR